MIGAAAHVVINNSGEPLPTFVLFIMFVCVMVLLYIIIDIIKSE